MKCKRNFCLCKRKFMRPQRHLDSGVICETRDLPAAVIPAKLVPAKAGSGNPLRKPYPDGKPIATQPAPPEKRNGVAYFLSCIRNDRPIEGPVSPAINAGVNEIIDAAKESIRTNRAVAMPAQ
jgi:predicted dehydrogenase